MRHFLSSLAILIAATVGAGIFSLPFVFQKAGFLVSAALLVILGSVIIITYFLYWEALRREDASANIFSLLKKYFGAAGTIFGFAVVICGLVLALGVLLIVGGRFIHLLVPFLSADTSVLLFWAAGCFFLMDKRKDSLRLETIAIGAIVFIILFLSLIGLVRGASANFHWDSVNPFFAFGPILFALSGWTGVEPVRDELKKSTSPARAGKIFIFAVGIVCAMYFLFAFSIVHISNPVTADTLSGVVSMGPWIVALLSLLGAVSILAGYFPLGLEARRLLVSALAMPRRSANLFIIVLPLFFVAIARGDFVAIISVTGGIFVSMQYILILAASRASCRFRGIKLVLWFAATAVFALAIVGEAYYLLVG